MRFIQGLALVAVMGCGGGSDDDDVHAGEGGSGGHTDVSGGHGGHAGGHGAAGSGSDDRIALPLIFPALRASTPAGLIADPRFQSPGEPSLEIITGEDAGVPPPAGGGISLGQVVQERLYSAGPTEILRIVHELDSRTSALETVPSKHPCLASAASTWTLNLPGGQKFIAKLQCLDQRAGSWIAFGFDGAPVDTDAGADAGGRDFYLVHGQDGGMGGAYRIRAGSANVDAWLTVADSRVPNNSQVIMRLQTDSVAGTTELTFAGSGVGFCSAHLKTGHDYLFIQGKTNAPPPPGTPMSANLQYCDGLRTGCFATSALDLDLGAAATGCQPLAAASFRLRPDLDASNAADANVTPPTVYEFFNRMPTGVPAF